MQMWSRWAFTCEQVIAARFTNPDTPVWDPAKNHRVGYKSKVTNEIATNLTTGTATTLRSAIFFGNWADLLLASFGSADLVMDPYTAVANGVVQR